MRANCFEHGQDSLKWLNLYNIRLYSRHFHSLIAKYRNSWREIWKRFQSWCLISIAFLKSYHALLPFNFISKNYFFCLMLASIKLFCDIRTFSTFDLLFNWLILLEVLFLLFNKGIALNSYLLLSLFWLRFRTFLLYLLSLLILSRSLWNRFNLYNLILFWVLNLLGNLIISYLTLSRQLTNLLFQFLNYFLLFCFYFGC